MFAFPRRLSNPPNPWAHEHLELLGPPPPVSLEVYEERARSILTRNDSPDLPFRWSLNPYRGCQHACAYCYARPYHEHLGLGAGTDFDSKIFVKTNAPALLRAAFTRRSWKRERISFSGVTDPYQPLEASYRLTRACLELARDFENPVGIITKSALVRRDAELLAELEERAGAVVFVSLPLLDEDDARALEPHAATPRARLETIRRLAAAGVPVGVAVAPLIPGLGDAQLAEVLERAREAGATRAFTALLRLPGNVAPVFEERLRAALPLRAEKILRALEALRAPQGRRRNAFGQRFEGAGPRWQATVDLFELQCRRLGYRSAEEMIDTAPRVRARPRQLELFPEEA
ncbi:MAG: radical SAM protein [Planctomycetes bacterium]|nr:radical SAM protein [Planctomycetota bacterium]